MIFRQRSPMANYTRITIMCPSRGRQAASQCHTVNWPLRLQSLLWRKILVRLFGISLAVSNLSHSIEQYCPRIIREIRRCGNLCVSIRKLFLLQRYVRNLAMTWRIFAVRHRPQIASVRHCGVMAYRTVTMARMSPAVPMGLCCSSTRRQCWMVRATVWW